MDAFKIFVVDDDPASRMIVSFHAEGEDYGISEFDAGESCLQALDQQPDVILLDVEMPGIGGIATCRAIREAGHDRTQIIFVSSHDDLDTRLTAYDAGGTDYIVKPYAPEELKQKLLVARRYLQDHKSLSQNASFAQQTAFTAMSSMGELGVALEFLKASFSCSNCDELAQKLFSSIERYGLQGMVELRELEQGYCFSTSGACTPLESSILSHARESGRLFQLGTRLAVNYPHVTLVVTNLPVDDSDRVGRLRDHLAIIAEGVDAKVAAIESEQRRKTQADSVIRAVSDLSSGLHKIEHQQADHRLLALTMMNDFISDMERSFLHMGLNEHNEHELIVMAQRIRDRITVLMNEGKHLGDDLSGITARLKDISET